jgi:hypothetical protein
MTIQYSQRRGGTHFQFFLPGSRSYVIVPNDLLKGPQSRSPFVPSFSQLQKKLAHQAEKDGTSTSESEKGFFHCRTDLPSCDMIATSILATSNCTTEFGNAMPYIMAIETTRNCSRSLHGADYLLGRTILLRCRPILCC